LIMKHLVYLIRPGLIAAFAGGLALFSGCNNQEDVVSVPDPSREVTFVARTVKGSNPTKATETTTSDIADFNVFALWSGNSEPLPNLAPASVSGGPDDWTYSPKQLWPDNGSIDFIAYSPNGASGVAANYSNAAYGSGDLTISYTVPGRDAQEDLLVAYRTGVNCAVPEMVSLTFRHALSRIQLKARPSVPSASYTVSGVSFLNLKDEGKLALNTDEIEDGFSYDDLAGGHDTRVFWGNNGTDGNNTDDADVTYTFGESDLTATAVAAGTAYTDLISGDQALLVLPQSTLLGDRIPVADFGNDVDPADGKFYIKITYASTETPDDKKVRYYAVREPLDPSQNLPLTFEIGRNYTFVVDLSGSNYIEYADCVVSLYDDAFGAGLTETDITPDPDPAVSADYAPRAHQGFAGSNIYWDAENQRLTFKDVDYVGDENKYQGLYFKWGSLVGISPMDNWSGSTVVYVPTGKNGAYAVSDATSSFSGTWANIVPGSAEDFTSNPYGAEDLRTNGYVTSLNAGPGNLVAYKGDICAYLSGRPGIPAGYWRLPTSADFEPDTYPDAFTTPGQYAQELGGLPVWPSSAGTSNSPEGTYIVVNGYTLTYYSTKTVFFPASGNRNNSTGALSNLGMDGYAWSSSAAAANGRYLNFIGATVNPANSITRSNGFPVRCVKK
jgi:hypothetical protein